MEKKETLQQVSDVTLEQAVTITVDIHPQYKVTALLQRWGILPAKRVFTLKPIYLGTLIRISKLLLSVELKLPEKKQSSGPGLLEANYNAICEHGYSLAEIVALALQNNRHGANPKLIAFIMDNFTSNEIMGVLTIVLKQMDLTSFMTSIISVRGLNVLDNQKAAPATLANGEEVSL